MLQQEGTGGETEWLPTSSAHLMAHKLSVLFGEHIPQLTQLVRHITFTEEFLKLRVTTEDLRKQKNKDTC